jgi:hypothetical protein
MSKTIQESHIIAERGVNAFADYCNRHNPYMLWRPENINDFGIDGEVELAAKNSNGKVEPTGEIIKIQIKATETGSYIKNETEKSFDFHARPEDIDYWNKHSLSVILIIFDAAKESLFGKKIDNKDILTSKSYQAIILDKELNKLVSGDNSFTQKFSAAFKTRINFDTQESISTNIFKFSKLPTFIYAFETKIKKEEAVYKKLERQFYPPYIIKENKIFSFIRPEFYPDFKNLTIKNKTTKVDCIPFKPFLKDSITHQYSIELLNKVFKDFAGSKGVYFNNQYKRYYFALKKELTERSELYLTRHKRRMDRKVAIYKKYIVTEFFRHFGFANNYIFNEEGLFMIFNPKLLFTSDRKNVLENKKKITELTNFITSREHNAQCLNHIHFIFQYLSGGAPNITITNFDNSIIILSKYISFTVPYGIPLDTGHFEEDFEIEDNSTLELFPDDED